MSAPITFTGTVKAWTTSTWQGIDTILHSVSKGKLDEAAAAMTYVNHDMSDTNGWAEVGVATVTVTLHPRAALIEKELQGLEIQLQRIRAENQLRENAILDRIGKLQALEQSGA